MVTESKGTTVVAGLIHKGPTVSYRYTTLLDATILNPPWLGELKGWGTVGNGEDRHFRLYFLDISSRPGEPAHQMLVSLCKEKRIFDDTRQGAHRTNEAQDRDILRAMRLGKRWCQKNGSLFGHGRNRDVQFNAHSL